MKRLWILLMAAAEEKAQLLRIQVLKETKIPISIGIAKTKVLAKLASHIAKKHSKEECLNFTIKI